MKFVFVQKEKHDYCVLFNCLDSSKEHASVEDNQRKHYEYFTTFPFSCTSSGYIVAYSEASNSMNINQSYKVNHGE